MASGPLPCGIVPVVQTPFALDGQIDFLSLERLVDDAVQAGAAGFLAPVVASEVGYLSLDERRTIVDLLSNRLRGQTQLIVGASADDPLICREMGQYAAQREASAWLVAVPQALYQNGRGDDVVAFFQQACRNCPLPLVIQDLQFNGPGLPLETLKQLRENLPHFCGIKIETIPSGPKYTAVRQAFGPEFYISGGWAVPQLIEALDRGVDAMIPESSMVRVYQRIVRDHQSGDREQAIKTFRALLPILVFSNQDLAVSIAFFKRLLVRKRIFTSDAVRIPGFTWDRYNARIADELIETYLNLEQMLK